MLIDISAINQLKIKKQKFLIHPTQLFADDSRTGSGPVRVRRVEIGQIAYNIKT